MNVQTKMVQASDGVPIPQLGFGVYKITKTEEFKTAIREAIRVGYRHFDTARIYGNEKALGEEIRHSGIPREQFFHHVQSVEYESWLRSDETRLSNDDR